MKRITYTLFAFVALLLANSSFAESIKLEWVPNTEPDTKGYNIYYGTDSRNYGLPISVDNVTQYQVDGLDNDKTYYFAITAVDTSGNESGLSAELQITTPSTTGPIPPLPPVTGTPTFEDDFEDGNFDGWEIVDEGLNYSPSAWSVTSGIFYQASNIHGTDTLDPGTYALNGDVSWTDYSMGLKIRSQDDDGIGVMVRYKDPGNYYLFSMGKQRNYRKLTKRVNGTLTVLAEDTVPYVMNQWYSVRGEVQGNSIKVYLDETLVFDVQDDSLTTGRVGLFSWGNVGSEFDNIKVVPIIDVFLEDDFEDGDYASWEIVDEGSNEAPSSWRVSNGVLLQGSNIYDSASPFRPGTYALNGDVFWSDYSLGLKVRSQDDDGIGVMVRYQDSNNYYLFSMGKQRNYRTLTRLVNGSLAVLAEDTIPYVMNQWYSVRVDVEGNNIKVYVDGELIFDVTDDLLRTGKVGLFSWGNNGSEFDDIVVSSSFGSTSSVQEDDTASPVIAITSPVADGSYATNSSTVSLDGTSSDNIGVTQIRWLNSRGGSGTIVGSASWSIIDIPLLDGENIISVVASDEAGNEASAVLTVTYTPLDITPPQIAITLPVTGGIHETNQGNVDISGNASDNIGITVITWVSSSNGAGSAIGTETWSISDVPLIEGDNIITVTAYDGAGNSAEQNSLVFYSKPAAVTFKDDFEDGDYAGWEIVDEGSNEAPSSWSVSGGVLLQGSNIYDSTSHFKPGTYALNGDVSWSDYSVGLKIRSQDDDGIGIMFRYQDSENYYLFSMGKQRMYRKLTKLVNGSLTVMAEDTVSYVINQWYSVQVDVQGNSIKVYVDNALIFDVTDDLLPTGKIGLFSWGNKGSEFDDIVVSPTTPLVQEVDETAPEISLTLPVSGGTHGTTSATINLSGMASDNIGVTQIGWANTKGGSGNAQGLETWTITDIPLVEGSNTIYVVAMDEAENDATTSLTVIYTLPDTTAPTLDILSPAVGGTYATNQATVDISGTAADNLGVDTVSWTSSSGAGGEATGKESWVLSGISLSEGSNTITVTAKDSAGNAEDKILSVNYTKPSSVTLIEDDFTDGDYAGWSIVDEGLNSAPSSWRVTNGVLYQGSNIFGASDSFDPGTYALQGESVWTNYTIDLKLRSQDDDGIGVMVRYQDSDNYYLFSMGKQRRYRKLTKRVNGVLGVLAEDTVPYTMNQWYSVRIEVQGSNIKVYLDRALLFDVTDDSIASGKVGLYSWGNAGSEFDDIFVE